MKKNIKIAFAASSGGHYEQLMMLKPLMDEYDSFVVTEKTCYSAKVLQKKNYYMKQVNRKELMFIPKMILNCCLALRLMVKEKPNIVICTGVLAMIPLCMFCKISGGKLIFIESFAKIKSPTLTGKLLYKYADRFYIQWESLREFYPNAIYLGGIY